MAGNSTNSAALASAGSAALASAGSTARIARILVDCGMIAREELEIVRLLMQGPPEMRDHAEAEKERGGPRIERSLPA